MTVLLYTLAIIGAVVSITLLSFLVVWLFVHAVARAKIRRDLRAAALTQKPSQ